MTLSWAAEAQCNKHRPRPRLSVAQLAVAGTQGGKTPLVAKRVFPSTSKGQKNKNMGVRLLCAAAVLHPRGGGVAPVQGLPAAGRARRGGDRVGEHLRAGPQAGAGYGAQHAPR